MTEQADEIRKAIPKIEYEEDMPLDRASPSNPLDNKLDHTDNLEKEITRFRFKTGRKVLYISMAAMGVAVVMDLIAKRFLGIESELVTNAFEAFKLITMTVLGYIFGSNNSK